MKRIARGLTLACMTAALLGPVAGIASAAPQTTQADHDDRRDERDDRRDERDDRRDDRDDCDGRYEDNGYNDHKGHNGYNNGGFDNGYYGGGIGLGLGLGLIVL